MTFISVGEYTNAFETEVFQGNVLEKKIFIYLNVHLVERLRILSEKFCFKFIQDKGCADPE